MRLALWGGLLVCLAGCATDTSSVELNRSSGSDSSYQALAGHRAAVKLEAQFGGTVGDPAAKGRMDRIARRLAQTCPKLTGRYACLLLASDDINAFSLPGRVYITQGLYRRLASDELLAAVIAHELSHIASRDHFKPACCSTNEVLRREHGADAGAIGYLERAGIQPSAMLEVLTLIDDAQPPAWTEYRTTRLTAMLDN